MPRSPETRAAIGRRAGSTLILALSAALVLATPAASAWADGPADCSLAQTAEPPFVGERAPAADLGPPFGFTPWTGDRQELLRRVVEVVAQQAAELGAPSCFQRKPEALAARVDFLSPFDFLVLTYYDSEPATRDALLQAYGRDPRQAIRDLSPIYPSPRADMILATVAYYDLDSDRIRVNRGKLSEADAPRVLVHEFWHAMPLTRVWTQPDGTIYRASGFWTQQRRGDGRIWQAVDGPTGLPFPPYLFDEAMATMMEVRFAGPLPYARRDLDQAVVFMTRLTDLAAPGEIIQLYLESRPLDFYNLLASHRDELS